MTTDRILKELEHTTKSLPEKALKAAVEQREAITPSLLKALDEAEQSISFMEENESYMLHIYAIFLLAYFREPRAYPLMTKFFQLGQRAIDVTEDIVTEDGERLLASVFDGDTRPLEQLIENENVEGVVRSQGMDALVCLVGWNRLARESVIEYFRSLYKERLARPGDPETWGFLISATLNLGAQELLEEVREAYRQQWVAEEVIDRPNAERILLEKPEAVMEQFRKSKPPVTDIIEEIRRWTGGGAEEQRQPQLEARKLAEQLETGPAKPSPYRATQKVGRNDRCPCGSGKKFKKCCGY